MSPASIRKFTARVRGVLGSPVDANEYVECRRCGTTLSDDPRVCPECGSAEIASYESPSLS